MALPKVNGTGFFEYERFGCPVVNVSGLECIALCRVAAYLGCDEIEALKRVATVRLGVPSTDPERGGIGMLFPEATDG